jgi:TetR/AcrR family transcriptional regulator, tetracycline repressor protein
MLSCRDGARLTLEGPLLGSPGALELMERLLRVLNRSGLPAAQVRVGADALMSYVTGFVLQEQLVLSVAAPAAGELAGLTERFPLVFGADGDLGGISNDELFSASVELLLTGRDAPLR